MNAMQLIGVSAFALAGAVSAQTVPAEAWVGPPIQFTSSTSREAVVADFIASNKSPQAPQELRVGPADPAVGAVSRAEAEADRNVWLRSGMQQTAYSDNDDPASAAHAAQLANYQRMRNGPEYRAELDRINGTTSQALAGNAAIGGN